MHVRGYDAEIFYEVRGTGPDIILIHPFPADHNIWVPVADLLANRYRVTLLDVRGLGESSPGEGPATMEKHAADLARVCDEAGIGRAVFAGNSIGGYILFEFWRRFRARVSRMILIDTKASADSDDARKNRLAAAEDVLKRGTEPFINAQLPKLVGQSTLRNRPDKVADAKRMMMKASAAGIAAVQRGMALRPDSNATLPSVDVPTLVMCGDEDGLTLPLEMEAMHRSIPSSVFRRVPSAGHYAPFEQPEEVHRVMRDFLSR
jgi:pimeloyl-ACP methyl ester carboxylesterase